MRVFLCAECWFYLQGGPTGEKWDGSGKLLIYQRANYKNKIIRLTRGINNIGVETRCDWAVPQ